MQPDRRLAIAELLDRLHRHKDAAYGDAWRRRGEVLGIFANIARKYDRMVIALYEKAPTGTEPLADTAADMLLYACKYLTWIAETDPAAFSAADMVLTAEQVQDRNGPQSVTALLGLVGGDDADPGSTDAAWAAGAERFRALEVALTRQAAADPDTTTPIDYTAKARLALELATSLMWYLHHLEAERSDTLDGLRDEVDRMDRKAGQ